MLVCDCALWQVALGGAVFAIGAGLMWICRTGQAGLRKLRGAVEIPAN